MINSKSEASPYISTPHHKFSPHCCLWWYITQEQERKILISITIYGILYSQQLQTCRYQTMHSTNTYLGTLGKMATTMSGSTGTKMLFWMLGAKKLWKKVSKHQKRCTTTPLLLNAISTTGSSGNSFWL